MKGNFVDRYNDLEETYKRMKKFGQRSTGIMDLDATIRETFADSSIGGVIILSYSGTQTTGDKVREDWIYDRRVFDFKGSTFNRSGLNDYIRNRGYEYVMIMYGSKSVTTRFRKID